MSLTTPESSLFVSTEVASEFSDIETASSTSHEIPMVAQRPPKKTKIARKSTKKKKKHLKASDSATSKSKNAESKKRKKATEENDQEEYSSEPEETTSKKKKASRSVNRQAQHEYFKRARTPLAVKQAVSGSLDYINDVPPIQTYFDSKKYDNKSILGLDIGSSFSKAMKARLRTGSKLGDFTTLSFSKEKDFLFPTSIFYSKKDNTYCVGKPRDFSQHADEWIELENIKRIFTVQELMTVTIGGHEFQVSQVMYELIKGLLQKLIHSKERRFTKSANNLGILHAFILTCPTGTSENIKKVYRNCALAAMNDVSSEKIEIEDVYIIEEFMLLKYCCDQDNDCQEPTLYVDIGHLTLDVTVVENIEHESVITYRNGDVGGLSIIHNIIKKQGVDPYDVMKDMFDSECEELPEELRSIEDEIVAGMNSIVNPICLIIFQKQVKKIHIAGAVTGCPYFANIIHDILKRENVVSMIDKRREYFKEKFVDRELNEFYLGHTISGQSALINGIIQLINLSLSKEKAMPLCLESTNSIEENLYYGGLLDWDEEKKEFGINIASSVYKMFVSQDFEIFILKFSSLIDIGKVQRITASNYDLVGVMEFERFTTLQLLVDSVNLRITNPNFFVKVVVDEKDVTLDFFFARSGHYYKSILKIEREGRIERIPLNDSTTQIFFVKEDVSTTWYGLDYVTKFVLQGCSCNRILRHQKSEQFEGIENEIYEIRPKQTNNRYTPITLEEIDPGDTEKALAEIGNACVSCSEAIEHDSKHEVTPLTIADYRKYLNLKMECGRICKSCYNLHAKNKKNNIKTKKSNK